MAGQLCRAQEPRSNLTAWGPVGVLAVLSCLGAVCYILGRPHHLLSCLQYFLSWMGIILLFPIPPRPVGGYNPFGTYFTQGEFPGIADN